MKARAIVRLTIDINLGDTWGANCSVEQVFGQAARDAVQRVTNQLRGVETCGKPSPIEFKFVTPPEVTTVIVKADDYEMGQATIAKAFASDGIKKPPAES